MFHELKAVKFERYYKLEEKNLYFMSKETHTLIIHIALIYVVAYSMNVCLNKSTARIFVFSFSECGFEESILFVFSEFCTLTE